MLFLNLSILTLDSWKAKFLTF